METSEIKPLFEDVVVSLDEKMRGFTGDSFRLPKLLIPQRAPDQTPFYPAVSRPIEVENAFDDMSGYDRSISIENRGREIFSFLSELPNLQSSNAKLVEAREDPEKLKEFYMRPEVMHEVRVSELLLDVNRANIMRLWVKMSDENFKIFLDLVKEDKLPKCLTSDQEMKRLLDDSVGSRKAKGGFKSELERPGITVMSSERPRLSSARERLVDLVLNPDNYVKDEGGHVITPELMGPKGYEFDSNMDILSVMNKLREEFPNEEK